MPDTEGWHVMGALREDGPPAPPPAPVRRQYVIVTEHYTETFTAIPRMVDKGNGSLEIDLTEIEDRTRIPVEGVGRG